jgi:hypothetical protein
MSGAVALPANDPYELRFFMPDGDRSFEVQEVKAEGAAATLRRDGPDGA